MELTDSKVKLKKKDATRIKIIESAFDAFSNFGYSTATISDISKLAGVSERTFYRYFSSKDEVVEARLHEIILRFLALLDEEPVHLEMVDALDRAMSVMNPRGGRAENSFSAIANVPFDSELRTVVSKGVYSFDSELENALLARLNKGFPEYSDAEVNIFAAALSTAILGAIRYAILQSSSQNVDVEQHNSLFMSKYRHFMGVYDRSCRVRNYRRTLV